MDRYGRSADTKVFSDKLIQKYSDKNSTENKIMLVFSKPCVVDELIPSWKLLTIESITYTFIFKYQLKIMFRPLKSTSNQ